MKLHKWFIKPLTLDVVCQMLKYNRFYNGKIHMVNHWKKGLLFCVECTSHYLSAYDSQNGQYQSYMSVRLSCSGCMCSRNRHILSLCKHILFGVHLYLYLDQASSQSPIMIYGSPSANCTLCGQIYFRNSTHTL